MDDDLRKLIFQAIDETISKEDFERLQDAIETDSQVREVYLNAVGLCDSLAEIAVESLRDEAAARLTPTEQTMRVGSAGQSVWRFNRLQLAVAASLMALVAGGAFWIGRWNPPATPEAAVASAEPLDEQTESQIAGHATLRRAVGLKWPQDAVRRLEGDVLPNGSFAFEEGIAEIDFFCGATVIVEGPASLEIESDWSLKVAEGRLRANVPPAARGFIVTAADATIVDLGTEFALEVSDQNARVEVIDGEVELRGGQFDGTHLLTGEGASLKGVQSNRAVLEGLSTRSDLQAQRSKADARLLSRWNSHSQTLRDDERLIAYFPIAGGINGRVVPNAAASGSRCDGLMVGPVERAVGRFGPESAGLEFDRPGSRVRTRIDGQFQAFTFACWAKIDRLEHRYNSLFMADGYENGEPHWQIRDDGRLMFSVMVDDSQEIRHFSETDQKMVTHAGLHHVYFTPPFWDLSQSGRWFHLAAVYDPVGRRVTQYVNGDAIASEEVIDKFHVKTLRIGPAEIGNWGQPFRKTPWFAVRHLNGTIDELAIFNAALTADEIKNLYAQGIPVGY